MARSAARLKLGYYPLVESEAKRIRQFLQFPEVCTALDPCAGTGRALQLIAGIAGARLCGVELDSFRAKEAAKVLDQVVKGSVFDTHSTVETFSLLYLNSPYDDEVIDGCSRRTEAVFLDHCFRWLANRGVLILVIPAQRLIACTSILTPHFRDLAAYRLTDPEAVKYRQVVLFGVRRTRYERERLSDLEHRTQREYLTNAANQYRRLPPLPEVPDREYTVPVGSASVRLV